MKRNFALETTVCGDLVYNGTSTCRASNNSNSVLIAAEEMNELLYPLKGKFLIVQTSIRRSIGRYFVAG